MEIRDMLEEGKKERGLSMPVYVKGILRKHFGGREHGMGIDAGMDACMERLREIVHGELASQSDMIAGMLERITEGQIIEQAEQNIRQALQDYRKHTTQTEALDDVSDTFIRNLARDSSFAKRELRELFSRSPVWDEKLDALVINGTRTHDPDYDRVRSLATEILYPAVERAETGKDRYYKIYNAIDFFSYPYNGCLQEAGSQAISELAPKAYEPGKKRSRVFKALCVSLGVADEAAGSEFQKLYAQFADELSARQIGFKLYVSINPAHFLTMSNPKADSRGCTLTSCHSFNSTDYQYNNGCSGYARDHVSFIAFTVDDPDNPELLNNRKTTRQVFAYRPGNGLLLQSRMYNTSGGTHGAQGDSKLYRDLIQREISMLEGVPNLWKTYPYCGGHEGCVIPKGQSKIEKYKVEEKAPKTENSIRILKLPSVLMREISKRVEWVQKCKEENKDFIDHDYISCQKNGLPHSLSAMNNALTRLCKRNGLPHISIHALRHQYATILLEQGVSLVKISALLGHSSVTTTFEYYCDQMDENDKIISFMNSNFIPEEESC